MVFRIKKNKEGGTEVVHCVDPDILCFEMKKKFQTDYEKSLEKSREEYLESDIAVKEKRDETYEHTKFFPLENYSKSSRDETETYEETVFFPLEIHSNLCQCKSSISNNDNQNDIVDRNDLAMKNLL